MTLCFRVLGTCAPTSANANDKSTGSSAAHEPTSIGHRRRDGVLGYQNALQLTVETARLAGMALCSVVILISYISYILRIAVHMSIKITQHGLFVT